MTKIGEVINYNYVSVKEFFRIPITTVEQGTCLINEGRNSVIRVHDKKLQHSWTLTHPHSFTCPVVFNEDDSAVYCVKDNNVLVSWSLEDENLNNATKQKFKESIFCLLPIPGHKLTVLLSSGKFISVESFGSHSEQQGCPLHDDLIWADATEFKSGIIVVCLTLCKEVGKYSLHHFIIMDGIQHDYYAHTLHFEEITLRNWFLNKQSYSFISIWSNGDVMCYDLNEKKQSSLLKIPETKKHHLLAIGCIDLNHIAVLKIETEQKESSLEIWDSKFKALKRRRNVKVPSPNYIQMLTTQSSIFLSYNEELVEIPYKIKRSTLADAIGKSLINTEKVHESSWSKGKLAQLDIEQISMERMVTSESEENSVEFIAKKLMEEGSNYLNHVTESQLVKLLSLATRHKRNKEDITTFDPDMILNTIFSTSLSDVFLIKFMKKLDKKETMRTLDVLLDCLNGSCVKEPHQSPSDLQLFRWICFVLQSHMEALLLSKDKKCKKLLVKLDNCLSEKMEEYEDYESIQTMFSVLKMKTALPKRALGLYCIETLKL